MKLRTSKSLVLKNTETQGSEKEKVLIKTMIGEEENQCIVASKAKGREFQKGGFD